MATIRLIAPFDIARNAGAVVRSETLQGKGNVVRWRSADIGAEVYVLVDSDATYALAFHPPLPLASSCDKSPRSVNYLWLGCRGRARRQAK